MFADLHIHSNASDGTKTPRQIFEQASHKDIEFISITDHDTMGEGSECFELANSFGVRYISGVELSCEGEIHILGYGIDPNDKKFNEQLRYFRDERILRVNKILEKLESKNIILTQKEVLEFAQGDTVGRVHIAKALKNNNICASMEEAFNKYLAKGRCAYVPRTKLTPQTAIELIESAGGVAVLAHPGILEEMNLPFLLDKLCSFGLFGLEVYYPLHSDNQVKYFEQLAKQRNIIVTSGSDYHGDNKFQSLGAEKRTSEYLRSSLEILKSL